MRNIFILAILVLAAVSMQLGCGSDSSNSGNAPYSPMPLYKAVQIPGAIVIQACPNDPQTTGVVICHYPPGNPANAHTICVGAPAVNAHVVHHADTVGACEGSTPPPSASPSPSPTLPPFGG